MTEFEQDLADNVARMTESRQALLHRLSALNEADLAKSRRGGWSVQQVLRHVIDAEVAYARVIAHLRSLSLQVPDAPPGDTETVTAAVEALRRNRESLLAAVDGVDEETFYDIRALGKDQYSVLSVLENVADHDHEHLGQINKLVASPA